MTRLLLTIIGDAYVEQFRPVRLKPDTSRKVGVPVYENDPKDQLRTQSAGGSAFLASMLSDDFSPIQVALPVREEWDVATLMRRGDGGGKGQLHLVCLPAAEGAHRVESFYTLTGKRWRVQFRYDEVHPTNSGAVEALDESDTIVIDDHDRGGITEGAIAAAMAAKPSRVIVSAEHSHQELYRPLLACAQKTVVICTERQALLWSEVKDPPPRLPPGSPKEHKEFVAFLFKRLRETFRDADDIIINRGNGPLSSLWFERAGNPGDPDGRVRYFERDRDDSEHESDGTPGVNTVYLAAFTESLLRKDDVGKAIQAAVVASSVYTDSGIDLREYGGERYFGRLERLTPERHDAIVLPSFVVEVSADAKVAWVDAPDYLKRAQLDGRLPPEESVLDDYYVSGDAATQIRALLRALNSYVDRPSKRPFNVLLEADPGSGKSYFAACLSRHLDAEAVRRGRPSGYHPLVEANLSFDADASRIDRALFDLYEDIRDERALGRVPVVLLDEFDTLMTGSEEDGKTAGDPMERLFARMLAPLWDGVFAVEGRQHRLGGFILLIAVSNPKFAKRIDEPETKARDFASRIDVRLNLKPRDNMSDAEKLKTNVRVAVSMLRKHFGSRVRNVQLAVLDAIGQARFRGSNRAIDQLIMMSSAPLDGTFRITDLPDQQLTSHIAVPRLDFKSALDQYGESVVVLT
jgi:hypothetical protein